VTEANFENDTRVRRVEGGWEADLHPGWNVGNNPNGGYLLAVATRAMAGEAAAIRGLVADPLTVTAHYLAPPAPGPLAISTEVVKPGRSFVTVMAKMIQGDREHMRVLGSFGDLSQRRGPTRVSARPPDLPPPDECVALRDLTEQAGRAVPEIMNRFDLRLPADSPWGRPGEGDPFEITGWIRLRDGSPPSAISAVAFADAFPPTLLGAVDAGWVPTIEMTVHVRAKPTPGWMIGSFRTRVLVDGLMEEDGELWSGDGRPVALSRQLATVLSR
jgi:acyl-CoA thioesterase